MAFLSPLKLNWSVFNTYWRFRHTANVHFLHYANLKEDLEGGVRQVANILRKSLDEPTIRAIAEATEFNAMKSKSEKFIAGGTDFWKDPADFLKAGRHGQWQGLYSEETLAAFDRRLADSAEPDVGEWLLSGGELPG